MRRKNLHPSEAQEQSALIELCNANIHKYPELELIFHIPNGAGKLSKRLGGLLKRMGLKKGVLDLMLPCQRGGYAGLFIEMKSKIGKPSKEQNWWAGKLKEQGYLCILAKGSDVAWVAVTSYLEGRCVRVETK